MSNVLKELNAYRTVSRTPPTPEPVLIVQKILGHANDHLESITVDDDRGIATLRFAWSSRGCYQDEDYDIPLSVLTAEDVGRATKIWRATNERDEAHARLVEMRRDLINCEQRLAEKESALHIVMMKEI